MFLERTPFYAESGGQIGDTGTIVTETGSAEVLDTTYALPNLRRHTRSADRRRHHDRADGDRHDRRGTPRRDPAEPHRAPTCSTTRCARCSASTSSRPARWSAPTGCGSTSRTTRPSPGADRRDRDAGQRRDAAEHADTDLRDHQGRGRSARGDRLLRRQVRRHRARARGRVVGRAVRRHPRACHRRHRHDQDRERIVDRLEPAPHRGRDRCGQRGTAPTRRAADRRCRADSSAARPRTCSAACNAGSTRSSRSTTRSRGCAASWRWGGPPNSRPSPTTVWSSPRSTGSRRATCAIWRSPCASSPACAWWSSSARPRPAASRSSPPSPRGRPRRRRR